MDSLMWHPPPAEMAPAVGIAAANRGSSRPTRQSHSAKEQHERAMRTLVMSAPTHARATQGPHGQSDRDQREMSMRAFIRADKDLAATADSIRPENLEVVINKKMSEIAIGPRRSPRRLRSNQLVHMGTRASRRTLPNLKNERHLRFVFDPSKYAGASAQQPVVIDRDCDHDHDNLQQIGQPQVRYLLRGQAEHRPPPSVPPFQLPILAEAARTEPPARLTTMRSPALQKQSLAPDSANLPGSSAELAIKIGFEDDNEPQRNKTWHYTGPVVPIVPNLLPIVAAAAPIQPLTKKQRNVARAASNAATHAAEKAKKAKAKAQTAKVKKPLSKAQKKDEELAKLRQQVKEMPQMPTAAGSWRDTIRTQVWSVRRSFFKYAKNEIHAGRRSYPVLIEALEKVLDDLKNEAQGYQTAASPAQPEVPPTPSRTKFWKLPVKYVSAGLSALKHHIEHTEQVNTDHPDPIASNANFVSLGV